jgi:hypothetical protein
MPNYDYKLENQEEIIDRSSFVASLNTINGMMNGGTGPQCTDTDP